MSTKEVVEGGCVAEALDRRVHEALHTYTTYNACGLLHTFITHIHTHFVVMRTSPYYAQTARTQLYRVAQVAQTCGTRGGRATIHTICVRHTHART